MDDNYECLEETEMDDNSDKLPSRSENVEVNLPRKKGHRYKSKGIYKKSIIVDGKYKCHHCDECKLIKNMHAFIPIKLEL